MNSWRLPGVRDWRLPGVGDWRLPEIRGISPLILTSLGLAASFIGLIVWLALTADVEPQASKTPDVAAGDVAAVSSSAPRPRLPLPRVPDPVLIEDGKHGPLPILAGDGRAPWRVYARPFGSVADAPRIAVVVAWLGLKRDATQAAIDELPGAVTLAFSPYAPNAQGWVDAARAAGHEVMLQIPMEPVNYPVHDPGPHTLLTSLQPIVNIDRLEWLMSRLAGYVGITDDMGSKFTGQEDAVRPVLEAINKRGLMYLDSLSAQNSVAAHLAREIGLPRVINNRFVDTEATGAAIDARLGELEQIALLHGVAVGLAHPYPVTVERLAAWMRGLADKGIALAPASAIVNRQSGE